MQAAGQLIRASAMEHRLLFALRVFREILQVKQLGKIWGSRKGAIFVREGDRGRKRILPSRFDCYGTHKSVANGLWLKCDRLITYFDARGGTPVPSVNLRGAGGGCIR